MMNLKEILDDARPSGWDHISNMRGHAKKLAGHIRSLVHRVRQLETACKAANELLAEMATTGAIPSEQKWRLVQQSLAFAILDAR